MSAALAARANAVLDHLLHNEAGLTSGELGERLACSPTQAQAAIAYAREKICPQLGDMTIPPAVPYDGYRYKVACTWEEGIGEGTDWTVGLIETRLRTILRDVRVAKGNADPQSVVGRRCNFLDKHLAHILGTLSEIR